MFLYSTALILIFITAVSSQHEESGFIGGEVLLPRIYSGQLPDRIDVSWRDKDDNVVLNIINGEEGKEDERNPKFKGRVSSFPAEYKNGNFSILIRDLRVDDAGLYDCYIPRVDYDNGLGVNLTVTERPADTVTSPRPASRLTSVPSEPAGTTFWYLALPFALLLVVCFIIIYFYFF